MNLAMRHSAVNPLIAGGRVRRLLLRHRTLPSSFCHQPPSRAQTSATRIRLVRSALSKLGDDGAATDRDPEALDDNRSPLLRFRSFPRKPLTVSDLTAGA